MVLTYSEEEHRIYRQNDAQSRQDEKGKAEEVIHGCDERGYADS